MNHDEHRTDSTLTRELRDSLSELAAPERPPLAAIADKGRAHQRRRLAGLGVAGVAAGAALAVGLTSVLSAAPGQSAAPGRSAAAANGQNASTGSTRTVQTTAFTLTSNANGTDTLTLNMLQMLDPATLQRALSQHGIPALVKTGIFCTSSPAPGDPVGLGVLTVHLPAGTLRAPKMVPAQDVPSPSQLNRLGAETKTVINPAKIPAGAELFFGYSNSFHAIFFDLINTRSYTCATGQPPSAP
jgi:hypothetical protein